MRLWSLHPRYLDRQGLIACWRESLLAQAVLRDETTGYRHHPQLVRFRSGAEPRRLIAGYLHGLVAEAEQRGYRFDRTKIRSDPTDELLPVTRGQLAFEADHLRSKLRQRTPELLAGLPTEPDPHPSCIVIDGPIADWEVGHPTPAR